MAAKGKDQRADHEAQAEGPAENPVVSRDEPVGHGKGKEAYDLDCEKRVSLNREGKPVLIKRIRGTMACHTEPKDDETISSETESNPELVTGE
jgi:hypothetical protein